MKHPDRPVAVAARIVIAHLQQSVQSWMDGYRILPADGFSLQAMLDRVVEGLADEGAPVVPPLGPPWTDPTLCDSTRAGDGAQREPWAGIEAFIRRVEALIEAGVLEAVDGRPLIEAARAMGAWLPSVGGSDG